MKEIKISLKEHKQTSAKLAGLSTIGILSNEGLFAKGSKIAEYLNTSGLVSSFAVCLKEAKVKGFDAITKEHKEQPLTGRALIFASACLGYLTPAEVENGGGKAYLAFPRLSFVNHLKTMSGLTNGTIKSRIEEAIIQNGFVFKFVAVTAKEAQTLCALGYIGFADYKEGQARLILCGIVPRNEVNSDIFKIRNGSKIGKDGKTNEERSKPAVETGKGEKVKGKGENEKPAKSKETGKNEKPVISPAKP